MKIRLLILFGLVTVVNYVRGQASECTTPEGGVGLCKDITTCPDLLQKAYSYQSASANLRSTLLAELQKRRCGNRDSTTMVCCSECRTPDNKEGVVKHIRNCAHVWKLFTERTAEGIQFVMASRMNTQNLDVCCGPPPGSSQCDAKIALPPSPETKCCGIDLFAGDRIVGGKTARIEEYPWTVVLEHKTRTGVIKLYCAGSLISSTHVVTAAHCIKGGRAWPPSNVRVGDFDTANPGVDCIDLPEGDGQECNDGAITVPIDSILIHPEYDSQSTRNDIALLRLKNAVKYTDYVRPICLPSSDLTNEEGKQLFVAGWGRINSTHSHSVLKQALKVPLVSIQNCQTMYPYRALWDKQLCAGGERGKDSCTGDSGGPLMAEDENGEHFVLTGVVSFGPTNCGTPGVPGMYTNVYRYLDWIQDNVRDHQLGKWITP